MKILILALSGIGDALMFTPAIELMRKTLPDAEIDALVMFRGVKDIYERNGNLNKVLFFDFMKEGGINSFRFLWSLRKKYDISINVYPSNRTEYNVINFMIGARLRAGAKYLRKDIRNFGWLNNVRITENDSVHNVITNIRLVGKLLDKKFDYEPGLDLQFSVDDISYAEKQLSRLNIKEDELVIGFHPGSATLKNHIHRRWDPENFAALARKLIKEKGAEILIFGGPEESELKNRISKLIDSPAGIIVESENLAQSAALMKRCSVFVSNDSSLMHVASAMKLKVVSIIGPTNPNYIHPWKTDYRIVSLNLECAPCFYYSPRPLICIRTDVKYKCIKELGVEMVYKAVEELLQANTSTS
jgi:heptosyltransferase-2